MLNRVLNSTLKAHDLEAKKILSTTPLWGPELWNLETVSHYQNLSQEYQEQLLYQLSDGLLMDSCHIESMGMNYCSKMNLHSRSEEEKIFYSFMAQEEAAHFLQLKPWFPKNYEGLMPSSFCQVLQKIINEGDRRSCFLLIQILLEGWGISYYQSLKDLSRDDSLKEVFTDILKDESRHHSAGVILYNHEDSTDLSNSFIQNALEELLKMVRVGPYYALQALERTSGSMTLSQRVKTLEQMKARDMTHNKLTKIRQLLSKVMDEVQIEKLTTLFQPNTLQEMASALET